MEKIFTEGMIGKRSDKAPEYVLVNLSVKVSEFTNWLAQNQVNGWVNIAVKRSQNGKIYGELDTFTPNRVDQHAAGMEHAREAARPAAEKPAGAGGFIDDDIPFSNMEYKGWV